METNFKNNQTPHKNVSAAPAPVERKKRRGSVSEYKKSLQEKQSLKNLYGLSEKHLKRYIKETFAITSKGKSASGNSAALNMPDDLTRRLETRLDNVVFRLGFAKSRPQARQLVSHSYFLVNKKPVNIPSFKVKKGDVIIVKEHKKKKLIFKDLSESLKKGQTPTWLSLDKAKLEGTVVKDPSLLEVNIPVEISLVFEFYSR